MTAAARDAKMAELLADAAHATAVGSPTMGVDPALVAALVCVALAAQGNRGVIDPSKVYDALGALELALENPNDR